MDNHTIVQKDFYRDTGKWMSWLRMHLCFLKPNLHYMYRLRKAQKYTRNSLMHRIERFRLRRLMFKYGFQIYPETQIGEGLYLGHWGTIIVNEKAIIGKNCNLSPGVVIGQTNRGNRMGVPTIGDYVWIGVNAVIVGNIRIGNHVLIAPGAYVITDVPDHSLVSGNPAVITPRENPTLGYINNTV